MLQPRPLDRRWGERLSTDCPSTTYRHGFAHRCRALDISTGGALLYWRHPQPPLVMRLELKLHDRMVRTLVRTLWVRSGLLAVRFIDITDAARLDIAEYLDHVERVLN